MKSSPLLWAFAGYLVYKSYEQAATEIIADVKLQGDNIKVTLTNPNLNPFYISGAQLHVSVGAQRIRIGMVSVTEPVYLGPQSTATFTPTIDASTGGLAAVLTQVDITKPVQINVDGSVKIGVIDIPVSFSEEYSLL